MQFITHLCYVNQWVKGMGFPTVENSFYFLGLQEAGGHTHTYMYIPGQENVHTHMHTTHSWAHLSAQLWPLQAQLPCYGLAPAQGTRRKFWVPWGSFLAGLVGKFPFTDNGTICIGFIPTTWTLGIEFKLRQELQGHLFILQGRKLEPQRGKPSAGDHTGIEPKLRPQVPDSHSSTLSCHCEEKSSWDLTWGRKIS